MSKNKHRWIMHSLLSLSFLLAGIFTPNFSAKADAGPSSSMNFTFLFQNDNVFISEGKLLVCPDKGCNTFEAYNGYFDCNSASCFARPQGAKI